MSVIEILWKLGYEILECNTEDGIYKIEFSQERKKRTWQRIKNGEMSVENDMLDDIYTVKVGEINFNRYGNFFIEFKNAYKEDECIDCYEYKNMESYELY